VPITFYRNYAVIFYHIKDVKVICWNLQIFTILCVLGAHTKIFPLLCQTRTPRLYTTMYLHDQHSNIVFRYGSVPWLKHRLNNKNQYRKELFTLFYISLAVQRTQSCCLQQIWLHSQVVEKKCLENFFKTFLSLLLAFITSSLNQQNTGLLQVSGPIRNVVECLLVPNVIALSYSIHWTTTKIL